MAALVKKSYWSEEEDRKLRSHMQKYAGVGDDDVPRWTEVARLAGLNRSGKSCRERWTKFLAPHIKRGKISEEEEKTIIDLQARHGNKWAFIARSLRGRTDIQIKNYWNTHLKKKMNIPDANINNINNTVSDQRSNRFFPASTSGVQVQQEHDDPQTLPAASFDHQDYLPNMVSNQAVDDRYYQVSPTNDQEIAVINGNWPSTSSTADFKTITGNSLWETFSLDYVWDTLEALPIIK